MAFYKHQLMLLALLVVAVASDETHQKKEKLDAKKDHIDGIKNTTVTILDAILAKQDRTPTELDTKQDKNPTKLDTILTKRNYGCGRHSCRDDWGSCHSTGASFQNRNNEYCTCIPDSWGQARADCGGYRGAYDAGCDCRDETGGCHYTGEQYRNSYNEWCTCRGDYWGGQGRAECDTNGLSGDPYDPYRCECRDDWGSCHSTGASFRNRNNEYCTCRGDWGGLGRVECDGYYGGSFDRGCDCRDDYGGCHSFGSWFPDMMDGERYQYCQCRPSGNGHTARHCQHSVP